MVILEFSISAMNPVTQSKDARGGYQLERTKVVLPVARERGKENLATVGCLSDTVGSV